MRGIGKLFRQTGLRSFLIIAAMSFVGLAAGQVAFMPSASAEDLSISGHVTAADTDQPLEGVSVTLSFSPFFSAGATTDANGYYTIPAPVAFNGYTLSVSAPNGYYSYSTGVNINGAVVHDVALEPMLTYEQVSVSGSVNNTYFIEQQNSGIADATIRVRNPSTNEELATAVTGTNGTFSGINLAPGTYIFRAEPAEGSNFHPEEQTVTIGNLSPTFGVGFSLDFINPPTYTVSGQVTDEVTGDPVSDATVTVREPYVIGPLNGDVVGTATTDAQGNYSVTYTLEFYWSQANYSVEVTLPHAPNRPYSLEYFPETANAVLGLENLTVDFELEPVQETVEVTLIVPSYLNVKLHDYDNEFIEEYEPGTHVVTLPADTYKLKLEVIGDLPPHQYGGSTYLDDIPAEVSFEALRDTTWTFTPSSPAALLFGFITDGQGNPVKGAQVAVNLPGAPITGPHFFGRSDNTGHYTVKVLPLAMFNGNFGNYETFVNPCTSIHTTAYVGNQYISNDVVQDFTVTATRDPATQISLCGNVKDVNGATSPTRQVSVYQSGTSTLVASATTDSKGNYAMTLEQGIYDVTFDSYPIPYPSGNVEMLSVDMSGDMLLDAVLGQGEEAEDTTPPVISYSLSSEPNEHIWHNAPVTIAWDISDSESDISEEIGCDETIVDTEGADQEFTCTATSEGGESSESVTISYESTSPTITGAQWRENPPAGKEVLVVNADDNLSGWAGGEVFIGEDPGLGSATPMGNVEQSYLEGVLQDLAPGTYAVSYRVRDYAGNWSETEVIGLTVPPATPPEITYTISGGQPNAAGWYNTAPTITWNVEDAESEVTEQEGCDVTVASQQGEHTYTCTATSAGGTATHSVTLKVDTIAPQTFTMITPLNGAAISGIHRFKFQIVDNASGIKKIVANVGGVSYSWAEGSTAGSIKKDLVDPNGWYIDVNTNNLPEGPNHIVLRPTDRADNVRYWNNRKDQHYFVVDNVQ